MTRKNQFISAKFPRLTNVRNRAMFPFGSHDRWSKQGAEMSKFKVHFKLQGLELDIEGTREDIPAISQSIGNQIANLIEPAAGIIDSEKAFRNPVQREAITLEGDGRKKSRRKRSPSTSTNGGSESAEAALVWSHDPAKYGTPDQSWNTATKSIWLLYVVDKVLQQKSMTSKQIKETFNKNFRQAGPITLSNTSRDLGKAKAKGKTSPVAEDNTQNPPAWFLTDAGIQQAQALIAGAGG